MNIFDRIKKIEKQALQLKSDADAIPVLFIKPFSGSKNLYNGEKITYSQKKN